MINMRTIKLYIYLLLLLSAPLFGQQKQVLSSLDSTRIKVGSQANLTLKTYVSPDTKVSFPNVKNIGRLEVLESYAVDTIEKGDRYELIKKYGLTQFDSGRYVIPPLEVVINGQAHKTDQFTLEVANVVVDTTKQKMFDIKPVASTEAEGNFWWYLIVLISFLLMGWGIWWDIKRRKGLSKPQLVLSPIDKAMGSLKRLDHSANNVVNIAKEYYSDLTGILRLYIEETTGAPAMESTTAGLMATLPTALQSKRIQVADDIYKSIETVLRNADMVKFALYQPSAQQITDDRALVEQSILTIEKSIPEPTQEEIEQTEAYKLAQAQKQRRRKRSLAVTGVAIAVIGSLAILGSLKLYGYLQENYIGYSTKELWEGEWVKSDYGNPAITISSPKVLRRVDLRGVIPEEEWTRLQEIQIFDYGVPFGDFSMSIRTMNYQPGIQPNIDEVVESTFRRWEQQGATRITTHGERFVTDDKFEGIRAYGNFTSSNKTRFYYEFISFQQRQGLQQIVIMYPDQDEYGMKIADKIKKSIRYRQVQ